MELFLWEKGNDGLSNEAIREALLDSIKNRTLRRALIIPPDFTRFHSNAGFITNVYYHALTERGCEVDILPALGTHKPVTREEAEEMFGDIPFDRFCIHNWRTDVVHLGEVPGSHLSEITDGLWKAPVSVEINKRLMDPGYDIILSPGQVVPHEVVGMANHAKNLFVGVGGSEMINTSHMVGAVYGMERMMGKADTPVRKVFDYALTHFFKDRPVLFILTVTTAPGGNIIHTGCLSVKGAGRLKLQWNWRGKRTWILWRSPSISAWCTLTPRSLKAHGWGTRPFTARAWR